MNQLSLLVLKEKYCIMKMSDKEADLEWLESSKWHSITKTDDELSVICPENEVPEKINAKTECGWSCFKIEGTLEFSLTGILSGILDILAEAKISILSLSTFNTDYVLVKSNNFKKAVNVLFAAGYKIEKQ